MSEIELVFRSNMDEHINKIKEKFKEYPIILKPSDGVEYHHLDKVLDKVYKIYNENELEKVIKKIETAGYNNTLIIQEFIPGDDSALFDSLFYLWFYIDLAITQ